MAHHAHTPVFAKPRRTTGVAVSPPAPNPRFIAAPKLPSGSLSLNLSAVLPNAVQTATAAGKIVFHSFGDSGGVYGTQAQDAVSQALEDQINAADPQSVPQFLFHLGDVVYFNGEENLYTTQFYEPYQYYNAPIFAIPGNHDGDTQVESGDPPFVDPYSLYGFMTNFCNLTGTPQFKYRPPMIQPYCYWSLLAPFVTFLGLYSNVDGSLDAKGSTAQVDWFTAQLKAVAADKWLIVAVHHPCYSLDTVHGGYGSILGPLDAAFKAAGRFPDMVLSGHVHDYQRFARAVGGTSVPYIVCGNAGYANTEKLLHQLQPAVAKARLPFQTADQAGVTLQKFDVQNSGFLRITASADQLLSEYFAVPFTGTADIVNPADSVTVAATVPKTV
jgi:predicted phosphodiesterase